MLLPDDSFLVVRGVRGGRWRCPLYGLLRHYGATTTLLAAFAQDLTESYFVRFRRFQVGQTHKVSAMYLDHYANEMAVRCWGWLLHNCVFHIRPNAPNLTRHCHESISKPRNGLRAGPAPGMICIPLMRM